MTWATRAATYLDINRDRKDRRKEQDSTDLIKLLRLGIYHRRHVDFSRHDAANEVSMYSGLAEGSFAKRQSPT